MKKCYMVRVMRSVSRELLWQRTYASKCAAMAAAQTVRDRHRHGPADNTVIAEISTCVSVWTAVV